MKNRKTARIIAIIVAFVMVFAIILASVSALTAGAVTQEEIDRLREEKEGYERRKQEIQSRINTIEYEKMTELAKKTVLDDRIILTGMEIENINDTIALYETLIDEKELDILDAIDREDAQLRTYMLRVRDMEENGIISYLEIIFDSSSFSDLLARMDFVGVIMEADENAYNDLITARNETIAAKEELEVIKLETENERLQLEDKYAELEVQLGEANAFISELYETLETETALYEAEIAEAERVQQEINEKVEELRRQEAAEAAAAAAAAQSRGSGVLLYPVPNGSGGSSDDFGVRLHPILGVYRQHWGVDIGGDYGWDIVASDSGTVIISENGSGYGNYVVIDHGNGMTTLYAHMSVLGVSAGDVVGRGQTIGYIGSTGLSTGPHLHFEVSVGGAKVNPEDYI